MCYNTTSRFIADVFFFQVWLTKMKWEGQSTPRSHQASRGGIRDVFSRNNGKTLSVKRLPLLLIRDIFMTRDKLNQQSFHGVFQQGSAPFHPTKEIRRKIEANIPTFVVKNKWPPYTSNLNPLYFSIRCAMIGKAGHLKASICWCFEKFSSKWRSTKISQSTNSVGVIFFSFKAR